MPTSLRSVGGAVQLALDLAGGVLRTVEQMHIAVARTSTPWAGMAPASFSAPTAISSAYAWFQSVQTLVAGAVAGSVRSIDAISPLANETGESVLPVAILNGICGDHLEATQNPLAIQMSLRTLDGPIECTCGGITRAFPRVSPHVAVWVHGLCLSERNWTRRADGAMGARLHEDLDITPVYVRYNSGRRISINGRELSDHLERMVEAWPVPVESLTLIGHSMGGLVIRSAGYYADREARAWRAKLRNIVCLGTPHHGASLERAGHVATLAMQASPYLSPFAIGNARSAGIKDLRYGNLIDEDWQDADQHGGDRRTSVPLLPDVRHYFAAASLAQHDADPTRHLLGDLLVSTASALGAHSDSRMRLPIAPENCRVFRGMSHFDLLGHPQLYEQLVHWLKHEKIS